MPRKKQSGRPKVNPVANVAAALRAEKVERLKELGTPWILLSAIESRSAPTVGRMASSIKLEVPDALILVGLWSLPAEGTARWVRKIKKASGTLFTRISIRQLKGLLPGFLEWVMSSRQVRKTRHERADAAQHL